MCSRIGEGESRTTHSERGTEREEEEDSLLMLLLTRVGNSGKFLFCLLFFAE